MTIQPPANIARTKRTLESLLRTEIAASEVYARAVDHSGNAEHGPALVDWKREHDAYVGGIRNQLARLHDQKADVTSGAVGAVGKAVEGVARIFGDDATLHALRAGEQTLTAHLEELATDVELDSEARALIATEMLPAARRRDTQIEQLLAKRTHG